MGIENAAREYRIFNLVLTFFHIVNSSPSDRTWHRKAEPPMFPLFIVPHRSRFCPPSPLHDLAYAILMPINVVRPYLGPHTFWIAFSALHLSLAWCSNGSCILQVPASSSVYHLPRLRPIVQRALEGALEGRHTRQDLQAVSAPYFFPCKSLSPDYHSYHLRFWEGQGLPISTP